MRVIRWDKGLLFRWRGQRWGVIGRDTYRQGETAAFKVQIQHLDDQHVLTVPVTDLADAMGRGELEIALLPTTLGGGRPKAPMADAFAVPPKYRKTMLRRIAIIRPLLQKCRATAKEVENIARAHDICARTVWNYLAAHRHGGADALVPLWGLGPRPAPKLRNQKAQDIFDVIVTNDYLKAPGISRSEVVKRVHDACALKGIAVPVRSKLYRMLDAIPEATVTLEREGRKTYERRFLSTPTRYTDTEVVHPLQLIEFDHTLLDIELVDEVSDLVLGRPWLTLGFDAYCRLPWGFYLSFDPPSAVSVMMCIRHGVLFKDAKNRHGTQHEWALWGVPQMILVDNAREFRSDYMRTLTESIESDLRFRPPGKPRYGGVIERSGFGTLNQRLLHNLLGNTKTNVNVKVRSHDPKTKAVWTMPRFQTGLYIYFTDWYPNEPHRGLKGRTPLQVWNEGLDFVGMPRYPADVQAFLQATLPICRRSVLREGIIKQHIHYNHPSLRALIGSRTPVMVRWNPLDLSYVEARSPRGDRWIRADAQDPLTMRMTAMEYHQVRRIIAARNQEITRETIRQARERLLALERAAVDIKVSRRSATDRLHAPHTQHPISPQEDDRPCEPWTPPPGVVKGLADL